MDAYGFCRDMPGEIIFVYRGKITPGLVTAVAAVMDQEEQGVPVSERKRYYHVLVECLQNILRHEMEEPGTQSPLLLIHKKGGDLLLTTGNAMPRESEATLRKKIDAINAMDKERLKSEYLELLSSKGFSEKGGAGLGLITLARKSGRPLVYRFDRLDGGHVYFTLTVTL